MALADLDLRSRARAHRPALPPHDPILRATAVLTWRERMVNEHSSSAVFESLGAQLVENGFDDELGRACRAFAGEERRHGVLCGAVVEALAGEAIAPSPIRATFPLHLDAPPRAAVLRNVVHICCMSETVAVALIGAERLEMPAGELRELLTRIYADEVGHARFGWRLLESVAPTLGPEERQAIEDYLPLALRHLEAHELAHLPDVDAPCGGEALGLCSGRHARVLMRRTIDSVIRPGLQRWFAC
jgi:hypothetical protein